MKNAWCGEYELILALLYEFISILLMGVTELQLRAEPANENLTYFEWSELSKFSVLGICVELLNCSEDQNNF